MSLLRRMSLFVFPLLAGCGGGGGGEPIVVGDQSPRTIYEGLDTGDVNGDGLTDIVAAAAPNRFSASPDSVDVFFQNIGNPGSFLANQSYPVGTSPAEVVLADLNGDLLLDVIVGGSFSANSFIVLLNDPFNVGKFTPAQQFVTGSTSAFSRDHIATGDIDTDGLPDIVVVNGESVTAHLQSIDGSFDNRQILGQGATAVAVTDIDQDGLLDIVTHNGEIGGNLLYYLQFTNVPGTFRSPRSIPITDGVDMLVIADLNGDNLVDIAVAGSGARLIAEFFGVWSVVSQNSSNPGSFTLGPRYETVAFADQVIDVGDLNDDGRQDIVIGNWAGATNPSNVQVFLQTANPGTFRSAAVYSLPILSGPGTKSVKIADLNADLLPDIVVSMEEIFVLFQDTGAPGSFGAPIRIAGQD